MGKFAISDVFNGLGFPKSTYVAQNNGKHENELISGIRERGTLCLLTGSSKTGKTTLYKKVFESLGRAPIIIRCDSTLTSDEFWKKPLETLNFDRLEKIQNSNSVGTSSSAKISGKLGWEWLASILGEVSVGINANRSEFEIKEHILSKPAAIHLVPLLQQSNAVLVVEDFHYLSDDVQKEIFQQWKVFTDEEVSVLVVGTTHHGVDLAYANSDLVGRIRQIDLGRWSINDLQKIAEKGFKKIGIALDASLLKLISEESSGLPIITQQICAQLFYDKKIQEIDIRESVFFNKKDIFNSFYNVANSKYKQFESWYTRLIVGPRKNARKYNTYEIILLVFTLDPLTFSLKRHEIDSRIIQLQLKSEEKPPAASINSTLSALKKFQENNGFELLEWSKKEQTIYVLEPSFLFFIRWRKKRKSVPTLHEMLEEIMAIFKNTAEAFEHLQIK